MCNKMSDGVKFNEMKKTFKIFCERTSIHGFAELHSAKNLCLTVFWIILLTSAFGLTSYQIAKAINQFTDQTTNTRSEFVRNDDMYPPIKICSVHWLFWLDWEKALSLKFSKNSILYGMSYYTRIVTSDRFDFNAAKDHFQMAMAVNNFTRIQQFYRSVAKQFPVTINVGAAPFEARVHMFFSKYWEAPLLCYTTPSHVIKEILQEKNHSRNAEIVLYVETQPFSWVSEYVTLEEYTWYMMDWFINAASVYAESKNDQPKNFSGFNLPLLYFAEGFGQEYLPIREEDDSYLINLSVQVNRWKSNPNNKCRVGERFISSNLSFCNSCHELYNADNMTCKSLAETLLADSDDPYSLCQNQIYQISLENNITTALVPERYLNNRSYVLYEELFSCYDNCIYPCEVWSYSFSYIVEKYSSNLIRNFLNKTYTSIQIVYPKDVIITIEVENQSWEDFVANIGGLLGVWTGASLLSLVQLVYLCCCNKVGKCSNLSSRIEKDNH